MKELELDRRVCFPKDTDQKIFLDEEQAMCKKADVFKAYFADFWYYLRMIEFFVSYKLLFVNSKKFRNWFDLISIILLCTCVFTHVSDIVNHNEEIARVHIRIMSVTVIFISLRLLKSGRLINEVKNKFRI